MAHAAEPDPFAALLAPMLEDVEGYCVKERKRTRIRDPQMTTMKNGRPAVTGTCPDCGAKMFKVEAEAQA